MGGYLGQLVSAVHSRDENPSKKLPYAEFSQRTKITVSGLNASVT